jgi:hypothetical protein
MAQVYVGNYEYDADEVELERALAKFGPVKSIEYKSGRHLSPLPPRLPPLSIPLPPPPDLRGLLNPARLTPSKLIP